MSPPRIGPPRVLFESDGRTLSLDCSPVRSYDVSCDEQCLYMTRSRMPPGAPPVVAHINERTGAPHFPVSSHPETTDPRLDGQRSTQAGRKRNAYSRL